jgi:pimeloyl-ACP methyl ester carboxylesterase
MADDLCYFLDRMGIDEKIVLCGLSMGGYLSLAFWRSYAHRLAGLILVATRAGADSAEAKTKRDEAADQARREGVGAIVDAMLPKLLAPANNVRPHLVQRVQDMIASTSLNGILGDLAAMRDRPDSTPDLGNIRVPTLIIHGAGDPLIPISEAQLMADRIPDSQLEIIPNAGHLPNLEQPELVNRYVRGFLQRLPLEESL